jgi:hypothetical protein
MTATGTGWARLRQVILVTDDIDADTKALRSAFNFGVGFHDTELADYDMADHTFTLADGTYLQLVASLNPQDALARWAAKIGGRGGYALSIQHPDPAAVKARAEALGVGVIRAQEALGYPIVQLHPRDTAILLEADGIADPDVWFWDHVGADAQPSPAAAVDATVAVEVGVDDPQRLGRLWHELLGLTLPADPRVVDLGGYELRFVEGALPQWTVVLRRAAGAPELPATVMPGVTFRYVEGDSHAA